MIEVKVSVQNEVYDFLTALYSFSKMREPFEEWLGSKIAQSVQGDLGSNLESVLDMNQLISRYSLDKIPEFADC